jgi:hypothetical protein
MGYKRRGNTDADDRDEEERQDFEVRTRVKRELTENCVVSELLSSIVLLVLVGFDLIADEIGMAGTPVITSGRTKPQRLEALAVYVIIMCVQVVGIGLSHQIIRIKNEWEHRRQAVLDMQRIRDAAAVSDFLTLEPPLEWHMFLSHMQSTAGDAVHTLSLYLQQRKLKVECNSSRVFIFMCTYIHPLIQQYLCTLIANVRCIAYNRCGMIKMLAI